MRRFDSNAVLTAAALTGRTVAWFPLWVLMIVSFCGRGLSAGCLILTLLAVPAAFAARGTYRLRGKNTGMILRLMLYAVTAAGGSLLLHHVTGRWAVPIMLSVVTLGAAIAGTDKPLPDLFSFTAYVFSMTCTVVSVLMLRIAVLPIPGTLLLIFAGVISMLYFLLRNQFMLYRMVNRRSRTEAAVPAEIRRGNLLMFGTVMLIIGVLFLFHAPLLRLLRASVHVLVLLIRSVGRGIARLIAWFGGAPPEIVQEGSGEPGSPLEHEGSTGSNPLWALLWIPFAAVTLYVCYVFLTDWVYYIRELFADLLKKLRGGRGYVRTTGHAEYTDTETAARREPSAKLRRHRWKKAYRAWQKMPEGSEKFYAGYQLLLTAPAWAQGVVQGSDTVLEIRRKWEKDYLPEDLLHAVTADFHADRYEEAGLPAHAAEDLRRALEALA